MGQIVFAAAMSHVLDPQYYEEACGPVGRQMTEETMAVIAALGDTLAARRPEALIVVADDHLNAFSFNAVPAICVRTGRFVQRMVQDHATAFDRALEGMPERFALHEDLANRVLEQGLGAGFDLAVSWEAPLDHAFLSPIMTLAGRRPVLPLVPIWVNCFVAPQPTPDRCFAFGRFLGEVVARSPWLVGIIATGGLSHFPELLLQRVGESDVAFDRQLLAWLEAGEHAPLRRLTTAELHKAGEHELLNWMVLIGAVSPARAVTRYFGELGRIDLAVVEWSVA